MKPPLALPHSVLGPIGLYQHDEHPSRSSYHQNIHTTNETDNDNAPLYNQQGGLVPATYSNPSLQAGQNSEKDHR